VNKDEALAFIGLLSKMHYEKAPKEQIEQLMRDKGMPYYCASDGTKYWSTEVKCSIPGGTADLPPLAQAAVTAVDEVQKMHDLRLPRQVIEDYLAMSDFEHMGVKGGAVYRATGSAIVNTSKHNATFH
jgi:hypothetical protein